MKVLCRQGAIRLARSELWEIDLSPPVAMRAAGLFGRMKRVIKQDDGAEAHFELHSSPEVCRDLEWFLTRYPGIEISKAHRKFLREQSKVHQRIETWLRQSAQDDYVPTEPFELALPLREYQAFAAERARTLGSLLLADDLGLGKTATAIGAINHPKYLPALIVTLPALTLQWEREIQRFVPGADTHILKSGKVYDLGLPGHDQLALVGVKTLPDFIICNYHKLSGWVDALTPLLRGIVFDEVQELRRGTLSQKGTAARALALKCAMRIGCSATPVYNFGGEIYNIMETIKPGLLGTAQEFTREWCNSSGAEGNHVSSKTGVDNPSALGRHLQDTGYWVRRTKRDVGRELPPLVRVPHHIDCDAARLQEIQGRAVELARMILQAAPNKEARKQAFTAGGLLDALVRQASGLAKAPHVAAFVELVLQSQQRVVLFGWHRAVYDVWMEALKDYQPRLFTGTESAKQKDEAIKAFREGDCRVLIMSLRAGAGLDGLQSCCSTLVFGELDWSPGVHGQCEGRMDRDGQKESVTAYYLYSEDGCDPIMLDVLGVKRAQAEGIRNPDFEEDNSLQGGNADVRKLAEKYLAAP